jgi:hypothetical protein
MSNSSLAAQAVADGPMTVAPPSFDGHGWLVVLNLGAMTAAFMIAMMVLVLLASDWWRCRKVDRVLSPAWLWRLIGILFATGITLRCGGEGLVLWGWNPRAPEETSVMLLAKRLVDPVAVTCGLSGLFLFILSLPGVMRQLRREPFPIRIWQTWPVLRRMGWLALSSLAAAAAVVSLR